MHNDLGTRMKRYELPTKNFLTKKMPVIIRIDGKAFHTFTKRMKKPFDNILIVSMWEAATYLCQNIQGCKIAYIQSDEISLLLTDYDTINTDAWFDYNIQKMASISASMATLAFNDAFRNIYLNRKMENEDVALDKAYFDNINKALFDSRVYSMPKEEVNNYFIWRQKDAIRNSIQMVGQANFSHKELLNKKCDEVQSMLLENKQIDWNLLPTYEQRGATIVKELYSLNKETTRTRWIVDSQIPKFTESNDYVNRYVYLNGSINK